MSKWYLNDNKDDIVLSSRIRLARNFEGYPFSAKLSLNQLNEIKNKVKNALLKSDKYSGSMKYIEMNDVPDTEVIAMVERHLISPEFAENRENRAILVSNDETACIMIGEEDHIRIQVVLPGLNLEEAYSLANEIDDLIISCEKYAYDDNLGFLTECPTNIGTGLRASVMLHLPILESKGYIKTLSDSVGKVGFTVRGMYGEGSKAVVSMYQISNQITLGLTERNAIDNLKSITNQLIEKERLEREKYDKTLMEDSVFRAYGILKYQRKISSEEMMKLVSMLMIGKSAGILNIEDGIPLKIFIETQPYMILSKYGMMEPSERDIKRADIIREIISKEQ